MTKSLKKMQQDIINPFKVKSVTRTHRAKEDLTVEVVSSFSTEFTRSNSRGGSNSGNNGLFTTTSSDVSGVTSSIIDSRSGKDGRGALLFV